MAEPLRRVSGDPYPLPQRQPDRRQRGRDADLTPRRLVSRQVQSNALLRRTIAWLFLAVFSTLFLLGFIYTYVKAGISQLNYQMHAMQSQNEQIILDSAKIKGQIAELRSLERIEAIATEELGMVKNESIDYMVLSSTVNTEGKIKAEETDAGKVQDKATPLEAVMRLIADRIFR